ncbi:hypothetical protein L6452_38972 [Arctium lappa]|uniref:Uncharacterized protein n=1 Tax=Arctium lappa TaxID=4217 RepID=A0ACB8XSR3_ARCLA|nr:hypothetical protein L6452_38972 [Arctium lappa]
MSTLKSHQMKDDGFHSKVLFVENSVKVITIEMGNLSRQSDPNLIKESLKSIHSKLDTHEGHICEILKKIPSTAPRTSRSLPDIPLNAIPESGKELIYIIERRTDFISEQIHNLTTTVDHALFHLGSKVELEPINPTKDVAVENIISSTHDHIQEEETQEAVYEDDP